MKIGNIVEPNSKGQIVIPKNVREALGIKPNTPLNMVLRGDGIYIYPVEAVLTKTESQGISDVYLELLNKTQGILGSKPYYKNNNARRKLELEASCKRKTAW